MRARIRFLLPFRIYVPVGEELAPVEIAHPDYKAVRLLRLYGVDTTPPIPMNLPSSDVRVDGFTWNGRQVALANAVELEFARASFERTAGLNESTIHIARSLVDRLIRWTRALSRASWFSLRPGQTLAHHLRYLDDDGNELAEEEGLVRGRGVARFDVPASITITNATWQTIASRVGLDRPVPNEADTLLLDAMDLQHHPGPSVVLAFTAIEVAASRTLARLMSIHRMPEPLCAWIRERRHDRRPSIEERLSTLLRAVSGHSLATDDPDLWARFQKLKGARNNFVHEGASSEAQAPAIPAYLQSAADVLTWLDGLLPEGERRPPFI